MANEYITIKGLKDFEMFVATFLYLMTDGVQRVPGEKVPTEAEEGEGGALSAHQICSQSF